MSVIKNVIMDIEEDIRDTALTAEQIAEKHGVPSTFVAEVAKMMCDHSWMMNEVELNEY